MGSCSDFHSRGDFSVLTAFGLPGAAKSRRFSRSLALVGLCVGAPRSYWPVDFFGGLFYSSNVGGEGEGRLVLEKRVGLQRF